MQNLVILAGNVGGMPETRTTQGGTRITHFSLATSRPKRDSNGKILRMTVDGIPTMGRNTQGVRLMDTEGGERVVSVAKLADAGDATSVSEHAQPADA